MAEDRIEHYARCPETRKLLCQHLGQPDHMCSLPSFLLVERDWSNEQLTLTAIAVYAVFRAMRCYRHVTPKGREEVSDALRQYCKAATYGHKKSATVLDWAIRGRFMCLHAN
eukprot:6500739-Karenia_brevis.AAC.1